MNFSRKTGTRLPAALDQKITDYATRFSLSKSDVVRIAVISFLDAPNEITSPRSTPRTRVTRQTSTRA